MTTDTKLHIYQSNMIIKFGRPPSPFSHSHARIRYRCRKHLKFVLYLIHLRLTQNTTCKRTYRSYIVHPLY